MPKGARAQYTREGHGSPFCPYECDKGLTRYEENPYCLDSADLFIDNIGGIPVVVIGCLFCVFFIAAVLLSLTYGKIKSDEEEEQ
jgi:hypothetical protein